MAFDLASLFEGPALPFLDMLRTFGQEEEARNMTEDQIEGSLDMFRRKLAENQQRAGQWGESAATAADARSGYTDEMGRYGENALHQRGILDHFANKRMGTLAGGIKDSYAQRLEDYQGGYGDYDRGDVGRIPGLH